MKPELSGDADDVLVCSVWQGCTCCHAVSHQLSILKPREGKVLHQYKGI